MSSPEPAPLVRQHRQFQFIHTLSNRNIHVQPQQYILYNINPRRYRNRPLRPNIISRKVHLNAMMRMQTRAPLQKLFVVTRKS
jgi:hypothetical protein